ncbi:MAG: hypothetical protein A2Z18_11095 [Armatimonadetes bacterium RBG_16_58_9]|nr:MAG: hypothetical protein A2Z18_11095 [Armatimonadetes bacterium RBG_16_58_9]
MDLIANRPLAGDYGYVRVGERFSTEPQIAESLLARGLASIDCQRDPLPEHKTIRWYETKVLEAPDNKAERRAKEAEAVPDAESAMRRGRRPIPMPCPACGVLCRSKTVAKEHCQ